MDPAATFSEPGSIIGVPMEPGIDLNVFKKNYLVAGLSDQDVARVAELAEFKVARAGEEIIRLGGRGADLYIILEGTAMVYREGGVLLGERGPNSVLGEIALVDAQPRSAYVTAKGTLTYAKLNGQVLRRFMVQNKEIGFFMLSNLARVLSTRLREASSTIEDLQGKLQNPWSYNE